MGNKGTIAIRSWLGKPGSFWILLGFAFFLRLAFVLFNANTPLVADALYYDGVGNAIVQGYSYEPYWPPGLTHYLAGWKALLGFDPIISRLAMLPWFVVLAIGMRMILRRLSGDLPANLGMLLLACFPAFVHHSSEPLSQLPAAALLTLAFDQYLRYRENRTHTSALLAGLFMGLLILFRPSALLLAFVWPVLVAKRKPRLALALIPVMLVVGLASTYVSVRQGRFILLNDANSRNFYLGNTPWTPWYKTWYFGSHWTFSPLNPQGLRTELETIQELPLEHRNRAYLSAGWDHIGSEPGMFLARSASKFRTFLAADSFTGARLVNRGKPIVGYFILALDGLLYLLVMALALRWWYMTPRPPRPFLRRDALLVVLLYALPYFVSFSHPTYHLPLMPLFICAAALTGAAWLSRGEGAGILMGDPVRGNRRWKLALLVLFLIQLEWGIQMAL